MALLISIHKMATTIASLTPKFDKIIGHFSKP